MRLLRETTAIALKEFQQEWRQRQTLAALALFVVATAYLIYLGFGEARARDAWAGLYWLLMIFASFSALNSGFPQAQSAEKIYLYTLCSPQALFLGRMAYNILLMLVLSALTVGVFGLFVPAPTSLFTAQFALTAMLGSAGLAMLLTFISGIAAQAGGSNMLFTVLGIPLLLPFLLVLMRLANNVLQELEWAANARYALLLALINLLCAALGYILFPYLWRD